MKNLDVNGLWVDSDAMFREMGQFLNGQLHHNVGETPEDWPAFQFAQIVVLSTIIEEVLGRWPADVAVRARRMAQTVRADIVRERAAKQVAQ